MRKKLSGFTLIEIIVVIVILGVIATAALPKFSATFERTKSAEGKQILLSILNAQKIYFLENGNYATDINNLDITIPSSSNFQAPDGADDATGTTHLGQITRGTSGFLYKLTIDKDGVFTCTSGTINCSQIGM